VQGTDIRELGIEGSLPRSPSVAQEMTRPVGDFSVL